MLYTTTDRKLEHQHTVFQSSHDNYTVNNTELMHYNCKERKRECGSVWMREVTNNQVIIIIIMQESEDTAIP